MLFSLPYDTTLRDLDDVHSQCSYYLIFIVPLLFELVAHGVYQNDFPCKLENLDINSHTSHHADSLLEEYECSWHLRLASAGVRRFWWGASALHTANAQAEGINHTSLT
jgi:hypothetical protein